jgi:hypothetical protein
MPASALRNPRSFTPPPATAHALLNVLTTASIDERPMIMVSFLSGSNGLYGKIEDQENAGSEGVHCFHERSNTFENLTKSHFDNRTRNRKVTRQDLILAAILVAWALTGLLTLSLWRQTLGMESETSDTGPVPHCKYN